MSLLYVTGLVILVCASALVIRDKVPLSAELLSTGLEVERAASSPKSPSDCFTHEGQFQALTQFGAEYQKKTQVPGAGLGEIVPFQTVLKDGFMLYNCIKDEMFYSADKFHDHRHAYTNSANVSIVHYSAVVPKEDQKRMTPKVCFNFCRTVPNMLAFGLIHGRECYCTPYFKQMASDSSQCDKNCDGDTAKMCGGASKSSVYAMHMCADAEGNLKKELAMMLKTGGALENATKTLSGLAKQAEIETSDFQQMLGSMGDTAASDMLQHAKVEAGVLKHLADDAEELYARGLVMYEEAQTMLSASLLQRNGIPDLSQYENVVKVEALTGKMTKTSQEGLQMLDKVGDKMKMLNKMSTARGQELATNRSKSFWDTYFFVNKGAMDANGEKGKSTCGGTIDSVPIFGLTKDECAYACDDRPLTCEGFSWLAKGRGVCLLLASVSKVTQYDMCSKSLEGECAPSPPTGHAASMLQEDAGTGVEHTSTPFPFKTKSVTPNATLFADSVKGMCTMVQNCDESPPGMPVPDCSLMDNYECRQTYSEKISDEAGGVMSMSFSGQLQAGRRQSSCSVNLQPCGKCKLYSTCAGPYAETEEVEIKKGDVASYSWTSSGATDNYEVFVGLYSSTCGLVDYQFQRGEKQEWKTFELYAPKTDKYYMKFLLASYDGTGGGAIGADMQVRDVKQTKATIPKSFGVEAKCMLKVKGVAGSTRGPETQKLCLKPDGGFPLPETTEHFQSAI